MFSHIELLLFAGKALPTCESSVILNRTRHPGFRSFFFHALFTLHVLGHYSSNLNKYAYSVQLNRPYFLFFFCRNSDTSVSCLSWLWILLLVFEIWILELPQKLPNPIEK
jgi:hypothetical protein